MTEPDLVLWPFALVFNGVIACAYFAMSWSIFSALDRSRAWRLRPIDVALGFIFLTCAIGHALHGLHLIEPGPIGEASRVAHDLHMVYADGATALVAVWFWSLRRTMESPKAQGGMLRDRKLERDHAQWLLDHVVTPLSYARRQDPHDRRDPSVLHLEADRVVDEAKEYALQKLNDGSPAVRRGA